MKWILSFSLLSVGLAAVLVAALWLSGLFDDLGIGPHGMIAMSLGITFTIGLGVGLMGLVFFSGRSRHDEKIGGDSMTTPATPQPHGPRNGSPV